MQYLRSVTIPDGYNGATALAHVCRQGNTFYAVFPFGYFTLEATDSRLVAWGIL